MFTEWLSQESNGSNSMPNKQRLFFLVQHVWNANKNWSYVGCQRKHQLGTSLVVQWIKIHLPMLGAGSDVWSRKTPQAVEQWSLCATATEPTRAVTTEAHGPRARAPQQETSLQWEAHAPQQRAIPARQLEKALAKQGRPSTVINKWANKV